MIDQEVASRVKEFKGKPQALQEKYAVSQQLIDLLALQKIKSMQESAAREMQLQMAQQQAANGESSSTIADQREKEVMDMTKQELAQQRGDLAQQQEREQKQAMQKLMGGITNAPGAASVMEPKALAAGGIVAFQSGNQVKDPEQKSDDDLRKKYEREATEMSFGTRMQFSSPEVKQMGDRIQAENQAAYLKREQAQMLQPVARPSATGDMPPASATPQASQTERLPVSEAQATAQAGPKAAVPSLAPAPMAPPQAANAPAPKPPAPPAPPAPPKLQQGLGGLQMGPPEDTLGNALTRESVAAMKIDPRARQLEEEKRIEDRLKPTPEQRGVYNEGIAGLKNFYEKDFDPELQRREGIKRYLLGMGGRSQGEFAGGAGAAMDYDTAQRNQQRARFGEMQKSREGLIGLDRAAVTGGIEGGYKAYEQGEKTKQVGLTSGANVYGTNIQSQDNAARNDVERLRIASSNAANAATRESNDLYRMQQESTKILRYRAEAIDRTTKPFAKQLDMLNMTLASNPKDVNALKEKQTLELRMEVARDEASKPFDLDLARVESYMYGKKGPIAGAKVEKLSK